MTYLILPSPTHSPYSRLTKELKDESAGLLAAAFIGIVPGYISRSVAGSYDNEAIAIFLLMFTFFLWIKEFQQLLFGFVIAAGILGTLAIVGLTYLGWIAPWTGRFYSLWDMGYAKKWVILAAL
jgi:dolichyl-diphosphooligosaccharide--protein glycosyltransferase